MKSILALSTMMFLLCASTAKADDMPLPLAASGAKFVKNCTDQAIDQMPAYRSKVCKRLRTQWQLETQLRDSGISHVDLSGVRAGTTESQGPDAAAGTGYSPPNITSTNGAAYRYPTAERAATHTGAGKR